MQKIAKFEFFWKINILVFSSYLWSNLTYRSVLYLNWKLKTFHLDLMLSNFWLKSISYERGSSKVVSFFLLFIISLVTFDLQECTIPQLKAKNISFGPYVINFLAKINILWERSSEVASFFLPRLYLGPPVQWRSPIFSLTIYYWKLKENSWILSNKRSKLACYYCRRQGQLMSVYIFVFWSIVKSCTDIFDTPIFHTFKTLLYSKTLLQESNFLTTSLVKSGNFFRLFLTQWAIQNHSLI